MILDIMTVQKVMKMKAINLTIDDIKKAIERYVDEQITESPNGFNVKFIIKDTYQPQSLTGYYKPELIGAEVEVLPYES